MHYYRKVIRIRAEDSPNVRRGLTQQKLGLTPTDDLVLPGLLRYSDYVKRRATWNKIRQCVGLDGLFYEGEEVLLYPADWLARANRIADGLSLVAKRQARAIGCDPAEGGDRTAWTVVDHLGILDQISIKTPNTTVVPSTTIALIRKWNVPHYRVFFDRGGGGKEHADRLELMGYGVRSVGFGESVYLQPKRGLRALKEQYDVREDRYAYKNRRAEMYGLLRNLLDPTNQGFGIPASYTELIRQMEAIPLWYDEEGRMYLPPKRKKSELSEEEDAEKITLEDLIGSSPDELDSLVLAIYAMTAKPPFVKAGAIT